MRSTARIGIDASAMLIARKHGYENYVEALLLNMVELEEELEGLELVFYFHAGNPLADPKQLESILPKFRRFRCRVHRHRHLFGRLLPFLAWVDRLDWLHLPVYLWSRWYPCPVGVTIHDTCGVRLLREGSFPRGSEAGMSLERHEMEIRRMLDAACGTIAVSDWARSDIAQFYGIPMDRISVVRHGTDPFFYKSPSDAQRVLTKYGLDRYILNVNAIQFRKNHERLVEAFVRLRQQWGTAHQLVLVGRNGWGAQDIRASIGRYRVEDAVRFLGYVPREDLRGLYSAADLVVNPSLCEGFGLPLLEAMACGVPVAASWATSFPEVGDDALFYFDPLDVDSMAVALWTGLTDTRVRTRLAERGLERARSFSWRQSAIATVAAYRSWGRMQAI